MKIKHHEFDRITMDPFGVRKPYSAKVEHLAQCRCDAGHDRLVEAGERAFHEAPFVDRAELVD